MEEERAAGWIRNLLCEDLLGDRANAGPGFGIDGSIGLSVAGVGELTAGLVAALANYLTDRRGKFGMGKPIEDDPADTDHPGVQFFFQIGSLSDSTILFANSTFGILNELEELVNLFPG